MWANPPAKETTNEKRETRNEFMNLDKLVHATAANNQLRCMAAVTTGLVGEACRRHRTFPTASAALGRALTGGRRPGAARAHVRPDGAFL